MINCSSSNYQLVRPTGVPFSVLTFPSFSRPKSIRLIIVTTLPFPLVQLIRNMDLECDVFASVDRTCINLSQLARIARRKLIRYKFTWCDANWEIFPGSIDDISMICYDFIARYFLMKLRKYTLRIKTCTKYLVSGGCCTSVYLVYINRLRALVYRCTEILNNREIRAWTYKFIKIRGTLSAFSQHFSRYFERLVLNIALR